MRTAREASGLWRGAPSGLRLAGHRGVVARNLEERGEGPEECGSLEARPGLAKLPDGVELTGSRLELTGAWRELTGSRLELTGVLLELTGGRPDEPSSSKRQAGASGRPRSSGFCPAQAKGCAAETRRTRQHAPEVLGTPRGVLGEFTGRLMDVSRRSDGLPGTLHGVPSGPGWQPGKARRRQGEFF